MNEVPGNQWAYKKYNLVTIYKLEITSCTIEMVSCRQRDRYKRILTKDDFKGHILQKSLRKSYS